jgi:glutamine amidotransferase
MVKNTPRVHICNYGIGNIYNVIRAFERVGAECVNCTDPSMLEDVSRLVIPGVGAFASCMDAFTSYGFEPRVREIIADGHPVLGICVGLQMLADVGEEFGTHAGLGIIPGRVREIPHSTAQGQQLAVPHITWSGLVPGPHAWKGTLFDGVEPGSEVYFVHSFHFECEKPENLLASFEYGGHQLTAAVAKDNVMGVQFHPEKSGKTGLSIIAGFLDLEPGGRA